MPRLKLALSRFAPALAAGGLSCALTALLCAPSPATAADGPNWAKLAPASLGTSGRNVRASRAGNGQAAPADADDGVDSEHIFGFTYGTDIGKKGDLELEVEPVAAVGKRFGTYFTTLQHAASKYTIADRVRVKSEVFAATHDIQNNPNFADRRQAAFAGAVFELRYQALDRRTAPFGLTFSIDPGWNRIDELTAERVEQYGSGFGVLIDKEIIRGRLFGAINIDYGLSATQLRETGEWTHDSAFGLNAALAYQALPGAFIGAEARYARQYEGLGLDRLKGEALYVGPTFYLKVGERSSLSGAWNVQVAGHAEEEPGSPDLLNFERQQMVVRFITLLSPD